MDCIHYKNGFCWKPYPDFIGDKGMKRGQTISPKSCEVEDLKAELLAAQKELMNR